MEQEEEPEAAKRQQKEETKGAELGRQTKKGTRGCEKRGRGRRRKLGWEEDLKRIAVQEEFRRRMDKDFNYFWDSSGI